jgi:hypothetical protein
MFRIKCINSDCTAPDGQFPWDDRAHAEGGSAQPGEPGAIAFLVECPHCGTENKVWLHKAKRPDSVTRGPND